MRLDFPATQRNREPIAQALGELWDPTASLRFLEVASGSGQHAAYFASRFPRWTFQPSDVELAHVQSIAAYRDDHHLSNLLSPLELDVSQPCWTSVQEVRYDGILAINLIHISPWGCTEQLVSQAPQHLLAGGGLYLYGAFRRSGHPFAPSNQAFDEGLRQRDPRWGVRCLDEVAALASEVGLDLESVLEMPANNLSVLFRGR